MVWSHGRRVVSDGAWGTLGLRGETSPAQSHVLALVFVQYRLLFFGFRSFSEMTTDRWQLSSSGFEDQRVLLMWLQDNDAGLAVGKMSVALFRHGTESWPLRCHPHQPQHNAAVEPQLFAAVVMQFGFCDGAQGV